ncbi:Receptor-Type Tyrosine-Protein Phosphatase Gamma [Manis pentadactyla]|nr:Receptor-Type Tyrosine-Protein Phosphatase Gamma [Manis pentadactyla]
MPGCAAPFPGPGEKAQQRSTGHQALPGPGGQRPPAALLGPSLYSSTEMSTSKGPLNLAGFPTSKASLPTRCPSRSEAVAVLLPIGKSAPRTWRDHIRAITWHSGKLSKLLVKS